VDTRLVSKLAASFSVFNREDAGGLYPLSLGEHGVNGVRMNVEGRMKSEESGSGK
jgi:hypothetical protein